jgi:RNA polymerase sigma-70 factor (ECF subfamily)
VEAPEDSAKILTVLAKNLARNRRRRHDRARPHLADDATVTGLRDDTASVEEVIARAETYARLVGCVATLGQMQRAVVELRLLDDIPGEQAARLLSTTPGNIAILLHRAKQKLRSCIT